MMGAVYITYAADVLRAAGLNVVEIEGWKTRGRSTGGYDSVEGICWHHTASGHLADGWPDVNYMTFRAPAKPIANAYVDRKGTWWIMAAGATNTEGVGGPLQVGRTVIPADGANTRLWSIEVGNNGIGETYPAVQQSSLLRGTAVMFVWLGNQFGWLPAEGLAANTRLLTHFEWTSRKIDNSGPAWWSGGQNRRWDMNRARMDNLHAVAAVLDEYAGQEPEPKPEPKPEPEPALPPPPSYLARKTGLYRVMPGEGPWKVSQKVYGVGGRYTELQAANPGKWVPDQQITVPGRPGRTVAVRPGEGPYALLRRLLPGDPGYVSHLDDFYLWNGGEDRWNQNAPLPPNQTRPDVGEVVFIPVP